MPTSYEEIATYEDERFISTDNDPLKFFKAYLKSDGEEYLKKRFESYDEPYDGVYDPEKKQICHQKCLQEGFQRGALLDEETNCYEYYIDFDEYVRDELTQQAKNSESCIQEKRKTNGDDQDLKLYKMILNECVDIHKEIIARTKLNFRIELGFLIHALYKKALELFEREHPNIPSSILAKRYFQKQKDPNITGFKLQSLIWYSKSREFYKSLIDQRYITTRDIKSFDKFFRGEIPKPKINWRKDPHELKYFIDCICNDSILEKMPKQQWIYLDEIFTCNGAELPLNWHRNRNKLKDEEKKKTIDRLTNMLLPRASQ